MSVSSLPSLYAPFRLTFLLPDVLAAFVRPGRHCPCLAGTLLTIEEGGLVVIEGKERLPIFDQARRFFRVIAKERGPLIIAAALVTPERTRECWEIVVNSDVTFCRDFAPLVGAKIEKDRYGQG